MNQLLNAPTAGFEKKLKMPEDACMHFYECENCKQLLKPLKGDCCVFCSYGSGSLPAEAEREKMLLKNKRV
ncbi:MAG: GDCCVxC domain-containing (seleno)protein [Melioribacteraceae bacterium]|nr:GDCCVxC domain-containing (seleno)protein [Melioribacteraceae bacterium]